MQQPTNVLRLIDIRSKYAKARYKWRWSHCQGAAIAEIAGISLYTAERWLRNFRQGSD